MKLQQTSQKLLQMSKRLPQRLVESGAMEATEKCLIKVDQEKDPGAKLRFDTGSNGAVQVEDTCLEFERNAAQKTSVIAEVTVEATQDNKSNDAPCEINNNPTDLMGEISQIPNLPCDEMILSPDQDQISEVKVQSKFNVML